MFSLNKLEDTHIQAHTHTHTQACTCKEERLQESADCGGSWYASAFFTYLWGNFSLTSQRYLLGVRRGVFWLLIDDNKHVVGPQRGVCSHKQAGWLGGGTDRDGCKNAKQSDVNDDGEAPRQRRCVWTCVDHPFNGRLITVFITSGDYQANRQPPTPNRQLTNKNNNNNNNKLQCLWHQKCISYLKAMLVCVWVLLPFVWSFHHPAEGYCLACYDPAHSWVESVCCCSALSCYQLCAMSRLELFIQ